MNQITPTYLKDRGIIRAGLFIPVYKLLMMLGFNTYTTSQYWCGLYEEIVFKNSWHPLVCLGNHRPYYVDPFRFTYEVVTIMKAPRSHLACQKDTKPTLWTWPEETRRKGVTCQSFGFLLCNFIQHCQPFHYNDYKDNVSPELIRWNLLVTKNKHVII